ncbi:hypothetical protein F442_15371 [Phytophthora nicotianae P10297]|uniref:Uncharacterized protein n=1 Tax=Phytophthora nicotianae P10297 TaxID=1317064 RepID=W2YP98_PHYNI|nr:hypothetical protein F442_15371 [Phytophthora nicotianae P10297]
MGMAKKNNPIENFNGQFKQQYTQRRLLRLNTLTWFKLGACVHLIEVLNLLGKAAEGSVAKRQVFEVKKKRVRPAQAGSGLSLE